MDCCWLDLEVTILARELGLKIELDDVPVALLQSSWGGSFLWSFFSHRFEQRIPKVKSLVPEKLQQWRAWKSDKLIMIEEKSFDGRNNKTKVGCSRWQEVGRCLRGGEIF